VRALWRIARGLLHVLHGALICAFVFPFLTPAQQQQRVGWWCARLLQLLGLTLSSHGSPWSGASLVVANHVSWLDILSINAVHTARFISKADVRSWPVLGWMVACGGTLFIERERKRDALRVLHQVAHSLGQGHTIALFPEGTTSDGHRLLPFHGNLLQAAIATCTPVQPVAIRFSDAGESISQAAAYVGDIHLMGSLWRVATASRLRVCLTWLPTVDTQGADRRALAEMLRAQIGAALNVTD